ncbi:hypothetical protein MNBD_GAMMA04-212 [hydrothermal vent metagenome]|uniref:Uncharacterized protein n=1 Tax=hydrothermal vent metagenome TaxID=652676 RepID=A0A3B0W2W6_9ZZZZ
MNAINPSLSAALSLQPQQNQMNARPELRMDDKSSAQSTNGGNSTVTLSDTAQMLSGRLNEVAASQSVRNSADVENNTMDANETTSGVSVVSDLQSKVNAYSEVAKLA